MQRIEHLNLQFKDKTNYNGGQVGPKRDDDVVIIGMARTAMTRAKRGPQKDTGLEAMLAPCLAEVIRQSGIKAENVEDVVIGNVLAPGSAATNARMAMYLAGFPDTTSVHAINRLCSSGLQSVATVANQIKSGQIGIGIGGGMESMTNYDMMGAVNPALLSEKVFEHEKARDCLMPMGITSENVAKDYKITREAMDKMAVESHMKAANAQKQGWSQKEITPYKTMVKDKNGDEKEITVDRDDGVRPTTTFEGLQKLKPAFAKDGMTTAGNSSQVTDGASCILLARRDIAKKLGAKIFGRIVSFSVAGVPPRVMGIGPAYAIPAALERSGLSMKDIDSFEINEAFASQALYCVNVLGVPKEKLNQRGGAMALGHPLGMTGSRMVVTLFHELERVNGRFGLVSMCIGTGMGACGIFERE
mmetsp:Transcript_23027/g.16354  ORF Transcript_23027/g.16354 Transcript_23027/m.16354 type:complete len:417 (+) Transcript_23027:61-1311(+)|eukprot:CAMPEP_0116886672 /NCGR_PEP_ID=MMETSP0463-20121206/20616_1 /TAXON_ID=181622 /ORGANISM="Strombidinopsis sp, Strain SopsisLIS2011" /LENGTH=416 /DNA_ID=CAMNT_0004547515 /DNA_START=27 /DNA_END=1277 /DNA_ORIENTATION=+